MLRQENNNQANFVIKALENMRSGNIFRTPLEGAIQGVCFAGMTSCLLTALGYDESPAYSRSVVISVGFGIVFGAFLGYCGQKTRENENNQHRPHEMHLRR